MRANGDVERLSQMSSALWSDQERGQLYASQSLQAVSLLDLTDEDRIDRAALILLERSLRQSSADGRLDITIPFFRLSPSERMILAALHSARLPYWRIARIIGEDVAEIPALAWRARLHLMTLPGANPRNLAYPSAVQKMDRCPEYDPQSPWTQRFLDEELTKKERLFLQNHLMVCNSCRGALSKCRDIYFEVDRLVPRAEEGVSAHLMSVQTEADFWTRPMGRNFVQTLRIFFGRHEVKRALLGITLALVVVYLIQYL